MAEEPKKERRGGYRLNAGRPRSSLGEIDLGPQYMKSLLLLSRAEGLSAEDWVENKIKEHLDSENVLATLAQYRSLEYFEYKRKATRRLHKSWRKKTERLATVHPISKPPRKKK